MIWNKGTIIYGVLLALFLGYYTYCSATGRSIYSFDAQNVYGLGNNYFGPGHVYVRGFNHK